MFTATDYDTLRELTFAPDYPHKPKPEIPNGDGLVDAGKQYRHVAMKYLEQDSDGSRVATLSHYLHRAHNLALEVAVAFGLPQAAWPKLEACALRVLEYPAGVGGHLHTDFDLFTLSLYRSQPEALCIDRPEGPLPAAVAELNPGCHRGELLHELSVGTCLADPHSVRAEAEAQRSIVYFALPAPELELPSGQTAGAWLAERYARSRA
jgi:isopenicillin N synthase-like dioxygenase